MRITPIDIRKQPFRKTVLGFDRDEVNSFLEMVANEFEKLSRQNDEMSTKVKILEERLDHYEKIEKTLNETLLTAQKATDEARINAQKEAELIIKDSQIRAEKYEDASRQKVYQLESDLVSLKTQRNSYLVRFKSMLRDQLSLLEVISGSLDERIDGKSTIKNKIKSSQFKVNQRNTRDDEDETMDEVPPQPIV
ncbi:MAG: DivIVA domain-containing protein [Chitinispirillia bacterium]|jgi:cell division initiation protein